MRLLVLGGTKFLGRHVVAHALDAGHEVTTFTRGRTNPDLFPAAEHLHGDRDGGLDALRGRDWDAVVDTSGYVPRIVRQSADLLRDAVQRYVFVSTISVYGEPEELDDPDTEDVQAHYGALKRACERVVEEAFGDRSARVRAGLIVGPNDPTDRFTYWPRRLAAGGDALATGDPAQPVQVIDARDLAAWLVELALDGPGGTFDATGPQTTLGGLLERFRGEASLVWVEEQRVLDAGVRPWTELPLWLPRDGWPLMERDASEAIAAGLTYRPLEETWRDTFEWDRATPGERPTLTREKEAEILARA
ncbi:MAG TPA: NAD-dependent epimerase/dehydratase family protein [Gaiellaceae bacterium]